MPLTNSQVGCLQADSKYRYLFKRIGVIRVLVGDLLLKFISIKVKYSSYLHELGLLSSPSGAVDTQNAPSSPNTGTKQKLLSPATTNTCHCLKDQIHN
jgi:hypothetical protein